MTSSIINKTCAFVENKLAGDGSGHDWWHIYRVWTIAKTIAAEEQADIQTVELAPCFTTSPIGNFMMVTIQKALLLPGNF